MTDVVAVSVGSQNLREVGALISRACLRAESPPLHLLAFENVPDASRALVARIESQLATVAREPKLRQLIPHGAIPDRACTRKTDGSSIFVSVERFGEILLEDSARSLF